jgi:3-methyladenine DNA glycosylase AlkD
MRDQIYYSKFKAALESKQDSSRAIRMKAYMKGQFEFYGVSSPDRKGIVSGILGEMGNPDLDVLWGITGLMWADPHREMQYSCMDITNRSLKILDKSMTPYYNKLIGQKSWWDSVDWLAPRVMGTLFQKYPGLQNEYLDHWINSGNKWYVRSAILFQLHYKEKTDFDLMCSLIIKSAGTKEFFINKASGWALRQYSKLQPELVIKFIDDHPELHNLTKREGLKWMKNKGIIE